MNADAREQLQSSGVTVLQYEEIWAHLKTWGQRLEQRRNEAGDSPASPRPMIVDGEEKQKPAKPTYKASLSGKSSWAVAEALGKVCWLFLPCRTGRFVGQS